MKMRRAAAIFAIGLTTLVAVRAQLVEAVVIRKAHVYTQTDVSTLVEPATGTWTFRALVEGTGLSGITAPTFTSPGGSGATGAMTYVPSQNQWRSNASYNGAGGVGQGLLDAAYNNGTYGITAFGVTVSPALTGNIYPNIPQASVSAGTWSGNLLQLNPTQALTISSNNFTGFSGDHILIEIIGPGYNNDAETLVTNNLSLSVPANSLTLGQTYTVNIMFDKAASFSVISGTSSTLDGANLAALYSNITTFTIQATAIPEPSTSAAIFGALGLLGAAAYRRRVVSR